MPVPAVPVPIIHDTRSSLSVIEECAVTQTEGQTRFEAMREQLRWRQGDLSLISVMADLCDDMGDMQKAKDLRAAAVIAEHMNESRAYAKRLEEEYQARLKEAFNVQSSLKKQCPHPVTEYEPDASGNNDSTTTCLCCGADI